MLAAQTITEADHEPLDVAGGDLVVYRDARHDEELVRPHLDRDELEDLVDVRLAPDRRLECLAHALGRCLSDDESASAPRELVRDVDEDDADDGARERVATVGASPMVAVARPAMAALSS